MPILLGLSLCLTLLATPSAVAQGPFDQGRIRLHFGAATAGSSGNRYFVLGLGVGYYLVDGLEVGLDTEAWLGGDPDLAKISPQLRYVFHMVPILRPYIGTFYKHWFVGDGRQDIDTIGGRLGAFYVAGGNVFLGGGIIHEAILSDCDDECSETYPEFVISVSF